jgi:dTDP-L-rhamnose 4-epimerase
VRTLVTGGAGFIGSHLVERMVARGDDVVVLDSLEAQVHADAAPPALDGAELVVGNVADLDAVGVGQSMYEIDRYVRLNTMATATFLERLVTTTKDVKRLVVASSMSIYGEGEYECETHGALAPAPRGEEQLLARQWEYACPTCGLQLTPVRTRETKPLVPTSVYAISKRDHEELCLVVGKAYGIPSVALRFFNVYGPGQALSNPYTGVAAIFASRLLNDRPPVIFEDGNQSRDFIHVSDIVEGILLAVDGDASDVTLNLGTGRSVTVNDVASALGATLAPDLEPERTEQYRAGDIRHCVSDPSRAEELLGFRAAVTFEDGMRDLAAWLEGQSAEDRVDTATRELVERGLAR